jgi:N-acetylglucosamine-6-phosphate deacetylase
MKVTPGLFDIQVNGFAGVDFNDENIDASMLDVALEAMLKTGVTRCLPTLITASASLLIRRFRALDKAVAQSQLGALMIPGYHLEGPFLNPAEGYAGCHPPEAMVPPDIRLIDALEKGLSRPILLVTCAPETDEGIAFVRALAERGKCVAVGHTSIDYARLEQAASAGVSLCTHLGNGIPQHLPKLNNTLQAQLSCDALQASFIADGLHIPPFALKNLLRAKTFARSILVTDAISAAACDRSGMYVFAGVAVERTDDGTVRLPGASNLAGSSLTLDQAIRNLVNWNIASFEQAIAMASTHPQQLMQRSMAYHRQLVPESGVFWNDNNTVSECRIAREISRRYP